MADRELQALEALVLSADKQEALRLFPSTSALKYYIEGILLLSSDPSDAKIDLIISKLGGNFDLERKLCLRQLLKLYEKTQDKEILLKINSIYFNIEFDNYLAPRHTQSTEAEQYPSVFTPVFADISGTAVSDKIFETLTHKGKYMINLLKASDSLFKNLLSNAELWKYEGLAQRFAEYYQNFPNFPETECFRNMTKQQMTEIAELVPEIWKNLKFLTHWVDKEYFLKSTSMTSSQQYEYMKFILTDLKDPRFPEALTTVVLLNILTLEQQLGLCEELWFFNYLSNHRSHVLYKDKKQSTISGFNQFLIRNCSSEEDLLTYYLSTLFFRNPELILKVNTIIDDTFLLPIHTKALILRGESLETLDKAFIPGSVLTSIELEPCPDNSKEFTRSESVKFSMQIKNIPRLLVKVLELNPKNYYLSTFQQINTNIKLDGLIAKSEYSYEFDEPAQKRIIKDFEFPELSGKVGVYVIEFFGNSRQNRVIIKKGSLRFVSHITSTGHAIYVMNEDNEICKGSSGVYLDSRFYASNEEGRVDIPFARAPGRKSIILTDGITYELDENFEHLSESYELRTAFFINQQQFVAGCSITILIKPRLYINGLQVSGSLLKQGKAVLVTVDSEGTSSSKNFQDLEIPDSGAAIELSFEVPPQLFRVNIEFSGEVENTDGEKVKLSSNHMCTANQILETSNMSSLFLNTRGEEYVLELRGRAGEPIVRQNLKVFANHIGWNTGFEQTLATDENGEVRLGRLNSISSLNVIVVKENGYSENYSWDMTRIRGMIEYPSRIRLCEGDEFSLPVDLKDALDNAEDLVWFYSTISNVVISNRINDLSIDLEHSTIKLSKLEPGVYVMVFKGSLETIEISVYEGLHLGKVILKDNSAIYTGKDYMAIGISSIQTQESNISVKVSGHSDENSKIFALYSNYLSESIPAALLELSKLNETIEIPEQTFTRPKNIFIPSTALDEEYQYVLDRKKLARFTGSTLDKPQLLLKRLFLQDTSTDSQSARAGGVFQDAPRAMASSMRTRALMKRSCPVPIPSGLNVPYDFLVNPAVYITADIIDGVATLPNLKNYSNLLVIAYNTIGSSYKLHPLSNKPITKELRLQTSAVDATEIYKVTAVNAGDTFTLNDFSNTSLEIIDSFSKLFRMLNEIAAHNKSSCSLKDWDFLIEWPRLSTEKKREYYGKFVSHELNLFIFNRDKEFFEDVVKPFIVCKMNKDIVDKYLCGISIIEYASIDKISRINNLERALVVDQLKGTNPKLAYRINEMLRSVAESQDIEPKMRNSRIEAVLRFNAVAGEEKTRFEQERADPYNPDSQLEQLSLATENLSRSIQGKLFNQSAKLHSFYSGPPSPPPPPGSAFHSQAPPPPQKYYKKLDDTKEFCETYYYNQPSGSKITLSPKFFAELSNNFLSSTPWLSETMIHCTFSLTELIAILSYAAIPFKPEKHIYSTTDTQWHLKASSPCLVFYKEIGKAPVEINPLIFIASKYYEMGEMEVNQFIKEKLYRCKVTITNTSGSALDFTVLTQIPEGAIAIGPAQSSKTHFKSISNYTTDSVEFLFYFPYSGEFRHHAGNIAVNGTVVAKTPENTIKVLKNYDSTKLETFKDLVISARKDLILQFLKTENLLGNEKCFDLNEIFWMLKNKDFWMEVVEIYRQRFIFNEGLWSFAMLHNEKTAIAELFNASEVMREAVGCYFDSETLKTQGEKFKHIEFDPIVNARAYKLGSQERITNQRFKEVYKNYLIHLAEKGCLENSDLLCLCQYFIYQERYKEASEIYQRIPMTNSLEKIEINNLQIQYDYLTCYLDLEKAKSIAKLYQDYSVPVWRKHFKDVVELLQELEEEDVPQVVVEKKEPTLNFTIENNMIEIVYEHVDVCSIRIYEIDLEILFSKNPFLIKDTQSFSYVKANFEFEVKLLDNPQKVSLAEYKGKNILVEVDYKTYSVSRSYFSNMLTINCIERFGVIKVMDAERNPRPAAYVKAFVKRKGDRIEFYKDGYTDIRGKFDYVSLNTDTLNTIEKFALLVVDDDLGSLVQEASPPPQ